MNRMKRLPHELTKTEKEVLHYLLLGFRHRDTAAKLFIAEKTVRFHTGNIYKKLGVKTQVELIFKMAVKNNKGEK